MTNVSVRDLRNNVSAVLRRVEQGEHLRVTVHGRPIADLVPRLCCPLYLVGGEEDANPSPAQLESLSQRLRQAAKTFIVDIFKKAGHAFFADYRPSYRENAAFELWPKMASFFEKHLRGKK